ncbi:MAG: BamA/TamA family outer membrane protein [Candidatus Marinimicrobia bacterium]|nr:BamA/TamA family outer membrane protein [Candidatus Neomarinimicrobiota bacterium]
MNYFLRSAVLLIIAVSSYDTALSQLNSFTTSRRAIRYNRVEGIHLGVEWKAFAAYDGRVRGTLSTGYGFKSEELTYAAKLNYRKSNFKGFEGNISYSHDISTNDAHLIGWLENSVSTLFAKEDYMDYFISTGIHSELIYRKSRKYEIYSKYSVVKYESLRGHDVWSFSDLVGADKIFSSNPSVIEGTGSGLNLGFSYDSRINRFMITNSLTYSIEFEKTGGIFGGDFEYTGVKLNIRKYKRMFGPQMLVLRGFAGVRNGNGEEQFLFDIGGIGTLRGYDHKEFTGDKAFILSADYMFKRTIFKRLPLKFLPFYPTMELIAFVDAGWTNLGEYTMPLNDPMSFDAGDVKYNIGIGYSFGRDMVRVNIAKRLDGVDGIKLTVRIFQRL